jgi:hypothetical protein
MKRNSVLTFFAMWEKGPLFYAQDRKTKKPGASSTCKCWDNLNIAAKIFCAIFIWDWELKNHHGA